MKIGFITTINTNIGDDFIRTGIENIIESLIDKKQIKYTYVNKHFPETAYSDHNFIRQMNELPPFKGKGRMISAYKMLIHGHYNVYKNQDLIIQSGAPVLWPDCHLNEWAQPIWYDIISKLYKNIPVINLAAGSCYPWENQNDFTNEEEKTYAHNIGSYCALTTTRDRLAKALFLKAGIESVLLPCTAFQVNKSFANEETGKYILINYMHGGGHFDWSQNVDAEAWEATIKETIREISKKHEVRMLCHNEKEDALAASLFPELKRHFPHSVSEYLECISHAKAGLNNRMHASVSMASVGVPAISVCTDTRLLMLDLLKLPIHYVKETTSEMLIDSLNLLIENGSSERKRLFDLKKETFATYQQLLKPFIK